MINLNNVMIKEKEIDNFKLHILINHINII